MSKTYHITARFLVTVLDNAPTPQTRHGAEVAVETYLKAYLKPLAGPGGFYFDISTVDVIATEKGVS